MTRCQRSTMGGMLERAMNAAFDSNGHRLPVVDDSWLVMMPKKNKTEPFYEMEFRDLFRIGRISRILNRIALDSPLSARVLGALYGDAGARWGKTPHGREASIYHLTETGGRIIESIRKRYPTSLEIRDDEVIVQDFLDQTRSPNDFRARKHRCVLREVDVLKVLAHRALNEADK